MPTKVSYVSWPDTMEYSIFYPLPDESGLHPSVRISFPEQVSEINGWLSLILHTDTSLRECGCVFLGSPT